MLELTAPTTPVGAAIFAIGSHPQLQWIAKAETPRKCWKQDCVAGVRFESITVPRSGDTSGTELELLARRSPAPAGAGNFNPRRTLCADWVWRTHLQFRLLPGPVTPAVQQPISRIHCHAAATRAV